MFTQVNDSEVWKVIDETRSEISTYLHSLELSLWDEWSRCEDWRVRDVVAHLILEYRYSSVEVVVGYIRSGFNINKFLRDTATTLGHDTKAILLQRFDVLIGDHTKPRAVPLLNMLVDLLVHEQDIRIALGQPRNMPRPALELIFGHWIPNKYNFGERLTGLPKRVKGLRFITTDIVFQSGDGKVIEGKAQDILQALVGREHSLGNLRGEGVDILKNRLNKKPEL